MEQVKKETSIYNVKGQFIEKRENIKAKPWTIDMADGMGGYGLSILKVLTRFTVLNKACILKSLQSVKPCKWKEDMLSKTLKALRKADMINMYQMDGNAHGDATLVIYCVSPKGIAFLKEKGIESSDIISAQDLILNTFECARRLALNQWHINMLYILKKQVKASYYNSFKVKDITVPSLITYRPFHANTQGKNKISIFAYQAPNDNESIEILAQKIVATFEFLIDEKNMAYRPGIIVILCENMSHTAWVSWKFNQFRQLRQLDSILYAIDITTNKERMLALLNECTAEEVGIVRTGINLE